ncbi:hypothetical protein SNE40_021539 [Patella caerulea]|uniref:Uncharacterized protein n=1 Tax=Patella caerulea TaxID=87958 RepID=A0AAN8J0L8_PATCE
MASFEVNCDETSTTFKLTIKGPIEIGKTYRCEFKAVDQNKFVAVQQNQTLRSKKRKTLRDDFTTKIEDKNVVDAEIVPRRKIIDKEEVSKETDVENSDLPKKKIIRIDNELIGYHKKNDETKIKQMVKQGNAIDVPKKKKIKIDSNLIGFNNDKENTVLNGNGFMDFTVPYNLQ